MKTSDAFPSNYLRAADLQGKTPVVTIDRVVLEKMRTGESKLVAYFRNAEKGLVLNKTNANSISDLLGTDETDGWTGKKIKLITAMVEYQGKRVPALRVEGASQNGRPATIKSQPKPEPAFVEDDNPPVDDSDIPF